MSCQEVPYGLSHPCGKCGQKSHITALCFPNSRNVSGGFSEDSRPSTSVANEANGQASGSSNHICINTGTASSVGQNILPTLSLNIKKGNKIVPVRVLLDFGSQSTYFHRLSLI